MARLSGCIFLVALCALLLPSCAFLNGLLDEYLQGQGFGGDAVNITVTPFDYVSGYPGPSDHVAVGARTGPCIQWDVEGVSGIAEYWVFVYSPVLYAEGLTAAVLPDVVVVEDIPPSVHSTYFGNWPDGVYVWEDPVEQPLKYNGTYVFWVAACDDANGWIGLGMAEVTVTGGVDPP
jgi:hypothetical protein